MFRALTTSFAPALAATTLLLATSARAAEFNIANTADAGSWSLITAQSFSATSTSGDTGSATGDTVYLTNFQFFQGDPTVAIPADTRLVILNSAYPDFSAGASTTGSYIVGISSNTLTAGSTFASGAPLSFDFDTLPLTYGSTYAAGLFSVSGTTLTPVQLSALTANYAENPPGSGTYLPVTNYGGLDNYNAAADYNVASSGYYSAFSRGGDSNFFATLNTGAAVPEPTLTLPLLLLPLLRPRR